MIGNRGGEKWVSSTDMRLSHCGIEKDLEHCPLCGAYPCVHIDSYVREGSDNRNRLEKLR